MEIRRKRIINLEHYVGAVPTGAPFRVLCAEWEPEHLSRIGFEVAPEPNDSILPAPRGSVSRFNADGRWEILRDQPKESRYIRTIFWRWKQWAGRDQFEEHEESRDVYRDCYPRRLVPPPSVEITYLQPDGRSVFVSPLLENKAASAEHIKHVINLFLEIFGVCELVSVGLAPFVSPSVRKVHWRMLPPGEYSWDRLQTHLDTNVQRTSDGVQRVIMDRVETIRGYGPDRICVGAGGFNDYLAYEFRQLGLVVLESIRRDNALYAFGQDWEQFSQLSKAEIISENRYVARIVHVAGWKERLRALLSQPAAA